MIALRAIVPHLKSEMWGTRPIACDLNHSKGCTTWTMKATDGGKSCNVVIVGSPNVNPGTNLVDDPAYPQMAQDYELGFRVLHALPCDIFLGAHGSYFDMLEKRAKQQAHGGNPFIDPAGYTRYVNERERVFHAELAKQKAAHR